MFSDKVMLDLLHVYFQLHVNFMYIYFALLYCFWHCNVLKALLAKPYLQQLTQGVGIL